MIKVTCAAVVALAIGGGLGWTLHSPDPIATPLAAAPRSAAPLVAATSVASGTAIDAGLLRSVVREELAAALARRILARARLRAGPMLFSGTPVSRLMSR